MIDFVATTVDAELLLAQERPGSPFVATLSRTETRWWLLAEHQYAVLPSSWQLDPTDADNAVAFTGRAAPAQLACDVESVQVA